ncbi:exported hypothetical protein [Candidatus Zixiibacteriota bacterium]|nr:exported hypothetical protein [candidate division Zixibacteria bacterium]
MHRFPGKSILRVILVVLPVLASSSARADWITQGQFSAKAGIDSIERFIVIHDIDTNKLFGYNVLTPGDLNGDQISDVFIMRWAGMTIIPNPFFLFNGGRPPDSIPDKVYYAFKPGMRQIGDVNDDGYPDFGLTIYETLDFGLYFGGPLLHDTADFVIPKMWSRITKAVDLNADGELEMPLSKSVNGGPVKIYHIGPSRDTIPEYVIDDTSRSFGNNLATGDFNGDGYPDLAVAAYLNRDTCFVKFYWGGPSFDTIPDYEIKNPSHVYGDILFSMDDFNGDGYDDLYISGQGNRPAGIHLGGPHMNNEPDIIVNQWLYGGYIPPTAADLAGDINHDGYPDLIMGYTNDVQFVYFIRIFLGGPDADSIPDVYLENLQIPGDQSYFGETVAGVGDFNGDGIDDFAVSSRNTLRNCGNCWQGEVNFFAGWNSQGTDVKEFENRAVPVEYYLGQNYPNPFNHETIIEFGLVRRAEVQLEIYNVLGMKINTLVNKELRVGSYKAVWDGRDENGREVSTGIYFYRLNIGEFSEVKKMILLK